MSSMGPKRFDAFLSYNSQDRAAVEELERRLRREGLALYLEVRELAPGREFQPALAQALGDSKTCVMFLGPSGLGPWQAEELQVAIDKRVRDRDFHVIPVLLPGSERPRRGDVAHLEFLINASWVEFLKSLDDEKEFQRLVWGITGKKGAEAVEPRYEGVCPYRGLEPFGTGDARFFFGRENLTDWLVSDLRREIHAPQGVRLLAVLGPSGSGKSSVVLAGLIPRVNAGAIDGSEQWKTAVVRPGDDPLANLAVEVSAPFLPKGAMPDVGQVRKLIEDLQGDERGLDLFARLALRDAPGEARLLVVVDQFEEVFTYRPQDEQAKARFEKARAAFFANLLHAAAASGGRVAVVLTMRSDFLGACASFTRLNDVFNAHLVQVGPMQEDELREAINRPAYLVGCEVEPALSERLLADVKGQPGALPLLQFALTEVWKKRDVRRLTLRAYEALGGVEGALEHRANEIFQRFKPEEQEFCRRIFLRLVQPGEGTEDTKRRVPYHELLPDDPERAAAMREVIRVLAHRDARLITTEGADATDGAVEVAHEALIRGWTQLRRWIETERAGLRIQRRLTEAAQEWATARPEYMDGYLYSGARLAASREWAATHRDELSAIEAKFLAASEEAERQREQDELENERRLREAAEAAREAERERAEDAEAAAKRQKQLGRRFLVAAIVASVLAVISVGLALLANNARQKAMRKPSADEAAGLAKAQARIAESRRLAALSDSVRPGRLDRAMLLALEASAWRHPRSPEQSATLHRRPSRSLSLPRHSRGRCHECGLRPGGHPRRGISRHSAAVSAAATAAAAWCCSTRGGSGSGPTRCVVKEGGVTSVAFGPGGTHRRGIRRERRLASTAWCCSTRGGAAPGPPDRGQGGPCHERGLRPRRAPSPRDIAAAASATAWCCSTQGGAAPTPTRSRSRRAVSRAWPSAPGAPSPRDIARRQRGVRRRRGAARREGGAAPAHPIEVKEGGVRSVAFGPGATSPPDIASARRRRRRGAARREGGAAPGRPDARSRRAVSRAWPSAPGAPSPRDTHAAA